MHTASTSSRAAGMLTVFFCVIALFFSLMIAFTLPKYESASSLEDLENADLSREYVCLDASLMQVYKGALYDSQAFATGAVQTLLPGEVRNEAAGNGESATESEPKYETCRIVLSLKPGITYGITGQTATYAQKVYVDGVLLSQVGTVSDDPHSFTPKTDAYTVYFTPQNAQTEIIVQHAWFNHQSGAFHKVLLAEQGVIGQVDRQQTLCDGVIMGALVALALFFFGMFLFNPASKGMLWFSLSCVCAALNYLIYESKQIMVFFPNLNWYVGHKIELLTNVYYFVFVILFVMTLLRIKPKKWFSCVSWLFIAATSLFYLAAPSTFYTKYLTAVAAVGIAYVIFALVVLLRGYRKQQEKWHLDEVILFASPVVVLAAYLVEGTTYFSHILYVRAYVMLLLAFCNAFIVMFSFSRTKHQLNVAQRKQEQMLQENALLAKMDTLKTEFMRNIAHEMKTPLTVMSGYAQLTKRQIEKNAVTAETKENLDTVAREALRLSDMVTHLLDATYRGDEPAADSKAAAGSELRAQPVRFNASELLDDAVAVCRPVMRKNNNTLLAECKSEQYIVADKGLLLQVLINLAVNANNHTHGGKVIFSAKDAQEVSAIAFTVSDTGEGIRACDLPYIFQRGYTSTGGNGLGLAICRDIIESLGGSLRVESEEGAGTTVRFTIPAEESVARLAPTGKTGREGQE